MIIGGGAVVYIGGLDDLKENTEAAKELGVKVWNLIPGKEDVVNLLTRKEFLVWFI